MFRYVRRGVTLRMTAWILLLAAISSAAHGAPWRIRRTLTQPPMSRLIAQGKSSMNIAVESFGKTKQGAEVRLFTLRNGSGTLVKLTDYGATVVAVETPDREGKRANITLSFPNLEGYLQRHPYFGSTVGRYGNRIAGGKFKIDGTEYQLAKNNGPNSLHGGVKAFDAMIWKAEEMRAAKSVGIRFKLRSPDGDEGFPGTLDCEVAYSLSESDELRIEYSATCDKATVVNLTNHCYWNLGGAGSGKVLDHQLEVAADQYLPIDEHSIPTGELAAVKGTPMDFTAPHAIGERIAELKREPHKTQGYDHCYVLRGQKGNLEFAARAIDPRSGRTMEVLTTEPGIQLYCGNFLDGSPGSGGFQQHDAFCLETQHYPDSPNQPAFPSTLLRPGQKYHSVTVHRFSVRK